MDIRNLIKKYLKSPPQQADMVGFRFSKDLAINYFVRNDALDYFANSLDQGLMVEVLKNGHIGYAATSNLTEAGIEQALNQACHQTEMASHHKIFHWPKSIRPASQGKFLSPKNTPLNQVSIEMLGDVLFGACKKIKISEKVVTRMANATLNEIQTWYVNSEGAEIEQDYELVSIEASATAQKGTDFQTRTLNGWRGRSQQIGAEAFLEKNLFHDCERVGDEAVQLVMAENCPNEKMDLLIDPDQMMLQIHESIGHPLEIDRILGDERNFAGWSFVKLDDIGRLQYGSTKMNVTFDPTFQGQLASYGYDDGGQPASKNYLIKDGILIRGLGGAESVLRSGKPGVSNFRASSWNRAPIDRMANINIEAGTSSTADLIASIDRGILLKSNRSWSIDDYRNKFQFGCEWGQIIENGKIKGVVKNPNYRGETLQFWRSLDLVGRDVAAFGTPYCGKGEPSQMIRVGHASPACVFRDIEVFGGET